MHPTTTSSWQRTPAALVLAILATLASVALYMFLPSSVSRPGNYNSPARWDVLHDQTPDDNNNNNNDTANEESFILPPRHFPRVLWEKIYHSGSDFRNEQGVVPSFWNIRNDPHIPLPVYGPCYVPPGRVNWTKAVQDWEDGNKEIEYYDRNAIQARDFDLRGFCRPGFVIIGTDKCGTSSLYRYITMHPRVLPAAEKPITFFVNFIDKGIKWYYAHFPRATSFLSAGALMTGEASSGYMYFPKVPMLMEHPLHGTKFIALGRDPLERAWSSYRFFYVRMASESMANGEFPHIPPNKTRQFYMEQYMYPFEDLLLTEMQVLEECLAGRGAHLTRKKLGNVSWAIAEFERREKENLPPLLDVDGVCYGKRVPHKLPEEQFVELAAKFPERVVDIPRANFHTHSLLGMGLYVFRLEWYRLFYSEDRLYFVCTEELSDMTGEPLNRIISWLGLPSHDMASIVNEGMYNVGGHEGTDQKTTWKTAKKEHKSSGKDSDDGIPVSEETRRKIKEFVRPYNERLFELVGKRCNW